MNEEKYYNTAIKEQYLETISFKATKEMTQYLFQKTKETELAMKKDIYEMNLSELGEVFKGLHSSSTDSLYNHVFKLEYYIDWAMKYREVYSNVNDLRNLPDKREWVEQFVSTYKQSLFTRDQILDMCGQLANLPDQAVLLALFEGIAGEGYSELLNLRTKDIKKEDGKWLVTLYDKWGVPRTIEISEKLAELLKATDGESVYYNKNGESVSQRSSTSILVDSPYIFKKSARGKQEGALDAFFVQRKFLMYKELFESEFITPKEVINSGILHMVNELHQEKGYMDNEDWLKVAEHFNSSFIKYNGDRIRNVMALKKKASDKKFEKVYGYAVVNHELVANEK